MSNRHAGANRTVGREQLITWTVRALLALGLFCGAIAHLKVFGYLPRGMFNYGTPIEWSVLSINAFVGGWACRNLFR